MKTQRNQKRAQERQLKEAYRHRIIVPANLSFNKIKSELADLGWFYEKDHKNAVKYNGKWTYTISPSLKLFNEVFYIALIPHKEGIEISTLGVYKNFQGKGYAENILKCILQFLLQHEIDDIFIIPLPAALPGELSSTIINMPRLQRFYSKQGFSRLPKNEYWKLDKNIFLSFIQEKNVDFELLKINYIPIGSNDFIGQSFKRTFQSMPIKMRIYNRA